MKSRMFAIAMISLFLLVSVLFAGIPPAIAQTDLTVVKFAPVEDGVPFDIDYQTAQPSFQNIELTPSTIDNDKIDVARNTIEKGVTLFVQGVEPVSKGENLTDLSRLLSDNHLKTSYSNIAKVELIRDKEANGFTFISL